MLRERKKKRNRGSDGLHKYDVLHKYNGRHLIKLSLTYPAVRTAAAVIVTTTISQTHSTRC